MDSFICFEMENQVERSKTRRHMWMLQICILKLSNHYHFRLPVSAHLRPLPSNFINHSTISAETFIWANELRAKTETRTLFLVAFISNLDSNREKNLLRWHWRQFGLITFRKVCFSHAVPSTELPLNQNCSFMTLFRKYFRLRSAQPPRSYQTKEKVYLSCQSFLFWNYFHLDLWLIIITLAIAKPQFFRRHHHEVP